MSAPLNFIKYLLVIDWPEAGNKLFPDSVEYVQVAEKFSKHATLGGFKLCAEIHNYLGNKELVFFFVFGELMSPDGVDCKNLP